MTLRKEPWSRKMKRRAIVFLCWTLSTSVAAMLAGTIEMGKFPAVVLGFVCGTAGLIIGRVTADRYYRKDGYPQ